MKLIQYITALAVLAACASQPPLPKKPDESRRVPINKPIPAPVDVVSTAP